MRIQTLTFENQNIIIMSISATFQPDRFSFISKHEAEISEEKLLKYHQRIINPNNQIDTDALQEYLNSVRASKVGPERIFTQKTEISYIISNVFALLKRMMIISQNEKPFGKILALYVELLKSRQNTRHDFGLIEEHLKSVLSLDLHRKNKKLYEFITKIFELNRYTVYKILQSHSQVLDWNSQGSLKIYQVFIEFAAMKKNITLLLKELKKCMEKEQKDLQRLKIILKYYPSILDASIIIKIEKYIGSVISSHLKISVQEFQIKLLETIKVFVALPWPHMQQALLEEEQNYEYSQQMIEVLESSPQHIKIGDKNIMILEYLQIWRNPHQTAIQSLLNDILQKLEVIEETIPKLIEIIFVKVKELSSPSIDQSQNFKTIKIILNKLGKLLCEQNLGSVVIEELVEKIMEHQLKEELVSLLDTIRNLDLFSMKDKIPFRLKNKIESVLSLEKKVLTRPQSANLKQIYYTNEDKKLALRALRKFKFPALEVNHILRQHILKKNSAQMQYEIKEQIIKNCLYLLRSNEEIDSSRVMREVLNLINKDMKLKTTTIQWFRDNENRYNKKIFEIFKEPEYLHMLFQDYSSNRTVLKRFSIKVLCFIYPLNQCEIVPFLKRAYYHIYDRLESEKIVTLNEKKQALRLTRQILRHRTEIICEDAPFLCNFLYRHLYKAKQYEDTERNELLTEIFKTIIDLFRKTPRLINSFVHPIANFIVKMMSSKECNEMIKGYALASFNEIIRNCGYVLIPYFHFPNLFEIIREMLKDGARGIIQIELLRLMGNLGFISKDKYDRIRSMTLKESVILNINQVFERNYKEIWYIKQIKNEKESEYLKNHSWEDEFREGKEETSYFNVDIVNFKQFILKRITRVIAEHSSKIINFMVFKVLEAIIPVLSPQETLCYQAIVLPEILSNRREYSRPGVFSLISKIVRYLDTREFSVIIIDYLLELIDESTFTKTHEEIELLFLLTSESPQIIKDSRLHKLLSFITEHLAKETTQANEIIVGLKIIQNLADSLNKFIHLFLPQFNKLFICDNPEICQCYFEVILVLCQKAPATEFYLPPITESLLELLKSQITKNSQSNGTVFIQKIINFTISLILIFGDKFKGFILNFRNIFKLFRGKHVFYEIAEDYMKKHQTLNYLSKAYKQYEITELFKSCIDVGVSKVQPLSLTAPELSRAVIFKVIDEFNCDKNEIEDESQEWFNKICRSLLEKSPQLLIRECLPLAKEERSFCYDLFPASFYFFWNVLCTEGQKKLTNKLKIILESKVISLTIKQKFLDTVYFMAQCKTPIPLKSKFLFETSFEVLDLAKALFYMESLFETDPEEYGESLIKMYAEIGEKQSAIGLLKIVPNLNTKTKVLLNQKLKRYHDALKEYEHLEDSLKPENMILQITIRKEMSDWESVMKLCGSQANKNPVFKPQLAPLAVEALINLGKWDQVDSWIEVLPEKHQNLNLWKSMYNMHEKNYDEAFEYINEDRKNIYNKICQLFNFSFERSMQGIIRLQQLCELEEANHLLKSQTEDDDKKGRFLYNEQRKRLENLWNDRIEGSKKNLNAMGQLLTTRNLLLSKTEDISNWLDFCQMCLKENHSEVSKRTLNILIDQLDGDNDQKKKFEIENLMIETKFILGQIKDSEAVALVEKNIQEKGGGKSDQSICNIYYHCALWLSEKEYDFTTEKGNKCIDMLKKTTQKMKKYIKGWHLMGLMHLKMEELLVGKKRGHRDEQPEVETTKQLRENHIFQALYCFIKSVSCGTKGHGYFLEDCLKIMNILFNENQINTLVDELNKSYHEIPAEGLIDIIPQIIGRLDIADKPKLLEIIKKLLVHIGVNHPQAIVFYLIFLKKGKNDVRKKIAEDIYREILRKNNPNGSVSTLYEQTQMIVNELCKVSLKLNEKFRLYMVKIFQQSQKGLNPKTSSHRYLKLCLKLLKEQEGELSLSQFGFLQQYRQEIYDIINLLELYLDKDESELFRRAERIIYRMLCELKASLKEIKKISLQENSPLLMNIKNTSVCLPGSYNPSSANNVLIDSFKNELSVIFSKQRPKKLIINGNDGKQYLFLLKGKEDLRLDQRIMQLFNLINKMFRDPQQRDNYSIQGYSITPISTEAGLIEWVQNCDTIGQLIIDYRASVGIDEKIEKKICRQICEEYEKLPKAHKVQIYKEIEERVSGNDLRNIFWLRSSNSQEWLKSRSCYIRSLAVMSIVGFVIGLGDRHPFNIMIQRNTGKVVHIDFGDCFDVNKMRKDFPEKVPFRLTRMLVHAMQSCGIHGIFTHTCEKIIKILRNNKESIIAIIEAFRYDPIIGWRVQGDEVKMIENSFHNNPTEESILEEEDPKAEKKPNIEFAVHVLNEIKKKLGGKSAEDINKMMSTENQVTKLIKQATSPQNLVEHFSGWSIYW